MAFLIEGWIGGLVTTYIFAWLVRRVWKAIRKQKAPIVAPHVISFALAMGCWAMGWSSNTPLVWAVIFYGVPQLFWLAMDWRTAAKGKDALQGPAASDQ
jgi:hypothetical protein